MARNFIVTNSGKRISDADAQRMVQAQLKETVLFCAAWDLVMPTITYDATGACVVPGNDVIDLADQPPTDENGVLGFHTEVNGQKRGTIFAGYELDNGGKPLALDGTEPQGAATIASIFSHELFEQLVNGTVNAWWDGPITVKGTQYTSVAGETADPVEDGFRKQPADDGTVVWLSNWITPKWKDTQSTDTTGFDANNTLTAPMTCTGYAEVRNAPGTEQSVFPDGYPEHRKKLKEWQWKQRSGAVTKAA